METVTVSVELLEELIAQNLKEQEAMKSLGFEAMANYYEGKAKAYSFILEAKN